MRLIIMLFTSLFLLAACATGSDFPTQNVTPSSTPIDQLTDPPVDQSPPGNQNPPSSPVQPGGPGKTPDPIQVEVPIGTLDPLTPSEPLEPAPGDDKKLRALAFIDSVQLLILESYPVQVNLQLTGSMPTPCHKLRVAVDPPDKKNRIYIDVYTVVDPDKICIQVIEPFATTVSLGTFPAGHYSVYVNDELIGEFDS